MNPFNRSSTAAPAYSGQSNPSRPAAAPVRAATGNPGFASLGAVRYYPASGPVRTHPSNPAAAPVRANPYGSYNPAAAAVRPATIRPALAPARPASVYPAPLCPAPVRPSPYASYNLERAASAAAAATRPASSYQQGALYQPIAAAVPANRHSAAAAHPPLPPLPACTSIPLSSRLADMEAAKQEMEAVMQQNNHRFNGTFQFDPEARSYRAAYNRLCFDVESRQEFCARTDFWKPQNR